MHVDELAPALHDRKVKHRTAYICVEIETQFGPATPRLRKLDIGNRARAEALGTRFGVSELLLFRTTRQLTGEALLRSAGPPSARCSSLDCGASSPRACIAKSGVTNRAGASLTSSVKRATA